MKIPADKISIINDRAKVTLWLAIAALVPVVPLTINHFFQERYLLGLASVAVIVVLLSLIWVIQKKGYKAILTTAGFIPVIILFLCVSIQKQQIIGALWCYPAVIVPFFILPRRQAMLAGVVILLITVPQIWAVLDNSLAVRVVVILVAVYAFSSIFMMIIETQQIEIVKKERQRKESMASASHELRTPLGLMMAKIEAMRDGIRPLNQEQLTSLLHSVDHLTNLVDDMFFLSLSDVGALKFEKLPVRLDSILLDTVEAASIKLTDHKVRFVNKLDKPVIVRGDAQRLRQIIENLLDNCGKYATAGGEISVTLDAFNDKCVEFNVSDTGPGVSDSQLPFLFDRFYRTEQFMSRQLGGTGLGLSMVSALTEVHGGKARAFHAPQGGLGVSIMLPIYDQNDDSQLT